MNKEPITLKESPDNPNENQEEGHCYFCNREKELFKVKKWKIVESCKYCINKRKDE